MNWTPCILPLQEAQARWRALWELSPQRSAFSSPAYLQALAQALGLEAEVHLVAGGGADGAGAVVFHRRRGPFRTVVVPPFTPYTSFLLAAPPSPAALHERRSSLEALAAALERRYHVLRFHLHPSLADVRVLSWRGWQARPLYTYRLALRPEAERFAGWSGSHRRLFQNSASGYAFSEEPEATEAVVRLAAESYGRHDRAFPAEAARLTRLVRALQEAGLARLFTVRPEGAHVPEAGLVVLQDGDAACYWIAGSRPGAAMTVLVGCLLPLLHRDGLRTLDFVGANTPSVAEFKRKFGAELVPYYRVEKITPPALRLLYGLRS